jgi:acyl carrier protein phosphodiesterase
MNYLAHAYLSFGEPAVLLGNMISDDVKGKKQFDYPLGVQRGIQLHRAIDAYTDAHVVTKALKKFFAAEVRLYAGAFVDVVYDHFLATDPKGPSAAEWMAFTQETYGLLADQAELFSPYFGKIFPYMRQQNWLYNYRFDWGVEKSFGGLVRRAHYLNPNHGCFALFQANKASMAPLAQLFLADVKKFSQDWLTEHLPQ